MATTGTALQISEAKLNEFMGKAVMDMGAAMHAVLILLGDRLGLYKAMADSQPVTPAELAARTRTTERYVREWLNANAASGYIIYDAATGTYTLPPEQAFALAVENSPAFLPGAFQIISACFNDAGKIEEAFRTGKGVGWHEHHHDLFHGTERFFRPNYIANLTSAAGFRRSRSGGKASKRRQGRGYRMRAGSVDDPDGEGLPEIGVLRLRLSRGIDRTGARGGRPRGCRRTAFISKSHRPKRSPEATTISSPSSIACTTWAIRRVRPDTCDRH